MRIQVLDPTTYWKTRFRGAPMLDRPRSFFPHLPLAPLSVASIIYESFDPTVVRTEYESSSVSYSSWRPWH